jgi:hypothetical protein
MSRPSHPSQSLAAQPVYLAARAINNVIRALPAGTAYFIGVVLIPMVTGQLVHQQGSRARAALPYVVQLRWGWQRVERARERGKVSLEALFARAFTGCCECWPVEPVRLGSAGRTVHARDSSPGVRLRAKKKRCALLGKGYCSRAQRAVPANLVAVLTTVVVMGGVRVGLVRRTRFGVTCPEAVANVFAALPESPQQRRFSVEAGIATIEQFQAAPEREALVGRLRKNVTLRRAPHPKRPGPRGRPARPGPVGHPGAQRPEGRPDEDTTVRIDDRLVRVRRWRTLHFRETPRTLLAVVRGDDPAYKRPLLIGTTARELTTDEISSAYAHRWPVETNFSVAHGTGAMAMPRAWRATAVARRIRLALLAGSLLKAIAAAGDPLPLGPWDVKAVASAGRLANHLALHARNFMALALPGLAPRTYHKITDAKEITELQLPLAA